MNARATEAVVSGRNAIWRPPLSSKVYISLRTTSVDSPNRWKTAHVLERRGDDQPVAGCLDHPAKAATRASHGAESAGRTSKVPGGWRSSGTADQATGPRGYLR